MPKLVFWPAAILTLGLIYLASVMGYLPAEFKTFWPMVMIIVGLGGLLVCDREEWMVFPSKKRDVATTSVRTARPATKTSLKTATKTKKTAALRK